VVEAARPGKVLTRKAAAERPASAAEMALAKAATHVGAAEAPAHMSAPTESAAHMTAAPETATMSAAATTTTTTC
jgi:hypothetical protein